MYQNPVKSEEKIYDVIEDGCHYYTIPGNPPDTLTDQSPPASTARPLPKLPLFSSGCNYVESTGRNKEKIDCHTYSSGLPDIRGSKNYGAAHTPEYHEMKTVYMDVHDDTNDKQLEKLHTDCSARTPQHPDYVIVLP